MENLVTIPIKNKTNMEVNVGMLMRLMENLYVNGLENQEIQDVQEQPEDVAEQVEESENESLTTFEEEESERRLPGNRSLWR